MNFVSCLVAHVLMSRTADELSKKDLGDTTFLSLILPPKSTKGDVVNNSPRQTGLEGDEKAAAPTRNVHDLEHSQRLDVSNNEWENASRALRTASWSAVFYLITTDILGPFNVPYVISATSTYEETYTWIVGRLEPSVGAQASPFILCSAAWPFSKSERYLGRFSWLTVI
jgi:hypothetical protein